jgi:DNA-directed RNA polymerase III subunit RPC2
MSPAVPGAWLRLPLPFLLLSFVPTSAAAAAVAAAAPIYVDIEYTRGREIVTRKGPGQAVRIGRMPLMLRCDR